MLKAKSGMSQMTIEAVVIRADGTRENLGVVSYWHKSPWRRLLHKVKKLLGGKN